MSEAVSAVDAYVSKKAAELSGWRTEMEEGLLEMITEDVRERLDEGHEENVKQTIDEEYKSALDQLEEEARARA